MYQWYGACAPIVWVCQQWNCICVIWDDMGSCLRWFPWCAPWGNGDFLFSSHLLTWCRFRRHCCGRLLCSPSRLWWFGCFHPWKLRRGGVLVLLAQSCWRWPLIDWLLLFDFLLGFGWVWMVSGSIGILLGNLPRLLPYLLSKGLGGSSGPVRVQLCRIHVPMLYLVCMMEGICIVALHAGHTRLLVCMVLRCPCCVFCRAQGL